MSYFQFVLPWITEFTWRAPVIGWWSRRRWIPTGGQQRRRRGQGWVLGEKSQDMIHVAKRQILQKNKQTNIKLWVVAFVNMEESHIFKMASKCNKSPVSHSITFGVRGQSKTLECNPQQSSCYVFISQYVKLTWKLPADIYILTDVWL